MNPHWMALIGIALIGLNGYCLTEACTLGAIRDWHFYLCSRQKNPVQFWSIIVRTAIFFFIGIAIFCMAVLQVHER